MGMTDYNKSMNSIKINKNSQLKDLLKLIKKNKILVGIRSILKIISFRNKIKLIYITKKCPIVIKSLIIYYCNIFKKKVVIFKGSSLELGYSCGLKFRTLGLALLE